MPEDTEKHLAERAGGRAGVLPLARVQNLAASVIPMAGSLAALPVLGRTLTPSEYGLWALVMTTIATLQLLDFGISASVMKFAAQEAARGRGRAAWSYWWTGTSVFVGVAAVLALIGALAGVDQFVAARTESSAVAVCGLFLMCVVLAPAANLLMVLHRALGRYGVVLIGAVAGQAAFLALVMSLGADGSLDLRLALVAQAAQFVTTTAVMLGVARDEAAPQWLARSEVRTLFAFGSRMLVVNGVNALMMYAPLWVATWRMEPSEAGVYAFASTLAVAIRNLPLMTVAPIVNRLAAADDLWHEGKVQDAKWSKTFLAYMTLAAGVAYFAAGPIGGDSYAGAGPVVSVLVGGYAMGGLTAVLSQVLRLDNRPSIEVRAWVGGCLIQLACLPPLVMWAGSLGAAAAVCLGQFVALIVMKTSARKENAA